MNNKSKYVLVLFAALVFHQACTPGQGSEAEIVAEIDDIKKVKVDERFMSIDNRCAWPNLTVLKDGTIVATIFNQPSHARREGDVECWASKDGRFWELRGMPAVHDKDANRMNVAAGLANNGDLLVVASGWSLKPPATPGAPRDLIAILRPWVSRSSDGGRTWKVAKNAFPTAESMMTEFIPFGDILTGGDGSLRVLAYAQSQDKETNKVSMFSSNDDGRSWELMSFISDGHNVKDVVPTGHNETAFLHLGDGQWIAAARRWRAGQAMDLFRSADDGKSWQYDGQLTKDSQHPGHLLKLNNGKLLLTYGNRIKDQYGVAMKISEDEGKTWTEEFLIVDDLTSGDSGYPSSMQLPDGRIMTAYYSVAVPSHQRYHMGSVIWNLP
jgi:hypothetical protein